MTLEEINQINDVAKRIEVLKTRFTKAPDTEQNLKDWDFKKHDVMDDQIRKKRKVQISVETLSNGTELPKYEYQEVNRIAIPIEQDVVNIHTAFTVGTEPTLEAEAKSEDEKDFVNIIKRIYKENKIKYANKKAVRSWLSECEVAEYWYTTESVSWWQRILSKITGTKPTRKLKSALWSPFRGDKLYPYFDNYGDLIAFSREYKVKDDKGSDVLKFMTIDKVNVTVYVNNEVESTFAHGFNKIPVMYMYRPEPLCAKIKTQRNRFETLLSNFADCLDYNFFPKLTASGVVTDIQNRGTGSEIIQLENGAEVAYLTWTQSPDMAKQEHDSLINLMYDLTNTPRVSFNNLKGSGAALSGKAFKYAFMSTHMAVSNHAEVVEEFLQRRLNFIVDSVGILFPKTKTLSDTITLSTDIVPYMIDNRTEDITDAVTAVQGGVASLETGIVLAGVSDRVAEEKELIEKEQEAQLFEPTS